MSVVKKITEDRAFDRLLKRLTTKRGVVGVSGLWGSSAPMAVADLADRLNRPILYLTAHLDEADETLDDIETFSKRKCDLLPAWETIPGQGSAGGEIHDERLQLCAKLRRNQTQPARQKTPNQPFIVAPIQAMLQPVVSPATLDANTLKLTTNQTQTPDDVVEWLAKRGFERLDRVEAPGDYARRGDIVDIYAHDREDPIRLEFFDDHLEAIRSFDPATQRAKHHEAHVAIVTVSHKQTLPRESQAALVDYLPEDTIVIVDRPADVQEIGVTFYNRVNRPTKLLEPSALWRQLSNFTHLHISRIGAAVGGEGDVFHFDVHSLARFEGKTEDALRSLIDAAEDHDILVYCANNGERARMNELLAEHAGTIPKRITLVIGLVHHGFDWRATSTIVVPHHEIFHRKPGRKLRKSAAARPIESVLDLVPGDWVVHISHGIARYRGMKTMQKHGSEKVEEFLTLEFADDAAIHVTTSQIDLIQKYIGAGGIKPTLSKLGGTRWKKTKERVEDAVSELAESLLRIQVEREQNEGTAYPADTNWQREFEESFPYEDTEDQIVVSADIKGDLIRKKPMDRLLCGDVGFGKTELALRAAFKVIEFGKQVAVLVPTTVLAEQHFRTFTERLAEYPFSIGCLSRFKTKAEQKILIEQAKKGRIDILIGTHRILSKDVGFADLGLIVIDEEQRFGVEHKERLKRVRAMVDVLSLSATPIPRTLHMALVGIRDISALQTPPMDRRAIASHVSIHDPETIRNAIMRELNREGQIFFIHNEVHSIDGIAEDLKQIVPEARIIIGHGQMKGGQLEKVMRAFVARKADILLATTIIESGIDIPTVNTIFINNADRFGLSDLHQLRGRVGRSAIRGYCYFLLPHDRPIKPKAAKRLKAIEEFSDLGAGFRIAMRDLEIRGAGNLLGPEQSGHIAAVGYEMYCQLLETAVRRARGETSTAPPPVHLELGVQAHIPRRYIASEQTRLDVYRRIKACHLTSDLERLQTDLDDAFGPPPKHVQLLLDLAELRILAAAWTIQKVVLKPPDLIFTIADLKYVQPLFESAPGSVRMPDPATIHLRMPAAYLEPETLLPILRKLLKGKAEVPIPT